MIHEQILLDMQYELAKERNIFITDNMPSKTLLYHYSKYRRERELAAQSK